MGFGFLPRLSVENRGVPCMMIAIVKLAKPLVFLSWLQEVRFDLAAGRAGNAPLTETETWYPIASLGSYGASGVCLGLFAAVVCASSL